MKNEEIKNGENDMHKKILYISSSIIPSQRANSVNVMKMCNAFKCNGYDVKLIATRGRTVEEDVFSHYGVSEKFNLTLTPEKPEKLTFLWRLLYSITYSIKYKKIYTRWPLAALFISRFFNRKIIMEFHEPPTSKKQEIIEKKLVTKNKNIIQYIFVSENTKKYYMNNFEDIKNENTKVIPNGADSKPNIKIKKLADYKKVSCGYIGSFYEGKGLNIVIKVANILPEITFHIVGGSKEEIFEKRKKVKYDNVKWYGYLPHKKAMKILNEKISIALLPNQKNVYIENGANIGQYTSPIKLFEYMSYGKAIIASDLSIFNGILKDRANSLLVYPDNLLEWKECILELTKNEKLFLDISMKVKNDFEKEYSWYKRAEKIIDCINEYE